MAITVLVTKPFPFPECRIAGEPVRFVPLGSEDGGAAAALVASAVDPLPAAAIAALPPGIGLIANFGVGTDNIDLAAARARGIRVSNTPVVTEDTADHAFALILAAMRRIAAADRHVRAGDWGKAPLPMLGMRVSGAHLGIAGFGAIGQAVARRAQGFGMRISYWSRAPKSAGDALGARHVERLEDLVGACDVVSLHLPLSPQTRHLLDGAMLARFRPGGVLVNTGRGALVDEDALAAALGEGRLGAAGLDVFEDEPRVHPGLLASDQVVLTPHIGSATGACRADMAARVLANLAAFIETGQPIDQVV